MHTSYRTLQTYMTCLNKISPIISPLGQTMHRIARKGTIISLSSKSI